MKPSMWVEMVVMLSPITDVHFDIIGGNQWDLCQSPCFSSMILDSCISMDAVFILQLGMLHHLQIKFDELKDKSEENRYA